jgi:predicted membrane-bound mannosyltransferase
VAHSRRPAAPAAGLLLVLLLAGALRLHRIGAESLWLDEAFSVVTAGTSLTHIVQETIDDVHPPLYYFLLHYWEGIAGTTEAAARLLSVVLSLATIGAAWALARRVAGAQAAFAAAVLLAISPFQIEFAQEARMYALLALAATLSTLAFLSLIERPRPASIGLLAATTAAMAYTQIHAVFVVLAHAAVVAGLALGDRARFRRIIAPWMIAELAALACFSPWIGPLASQMLRVGGHFWIPRPAWFDAADPLIAYAGSVRLARVIGAAAAAGLVAGIAARAPYGRRVGTLTLAAWLAASVGGPLAVSQFGTSIFLPKYTIAASVPFAILAGIGLGVVRRWWFTAAALAAIAWLTWTPLDRFYTRPRKDDWRAAAALVEQAARPGDVVMFYPDYNEIPYDYYRRRTDLVERPLPIYTDLPGPPPLPLVVKGAIQPHDRVWLILLRGDALHEAIVAEASRWRRLTAERHPPRLDIYFFERR